jgi:tetratricopeptide (TPR) repeat protein
LQRGQIANAVICSAMLARCHYALGNFPEAAAIHERGKALADRLPGGSVQRTQLAAAAHERRLAFDAGWEASFEEFEPHGDWQPEFFWLFAAFQANAAVVMARLGRVDDAMNFLAAAVPAVERAPAWAPTYPGVTCSAIEVLWLLGRREYVEVLERNLREKVLQPDFRYLMHDARLSLARLCALQDRNDEAVEWFAKARAVLDEQGARPLRAIVDYDEALMYARRGEPGDAAPARPLLDAALAQFRTLGMPGWIRRAEALLKRCAAGGARAEGHSP